MTGKNLEEAKRLIHEGIDIYLDELKRRGEHMPEPTTEAEYVELSS